MRRLEAQAKAERTPSVSAAPQRTLNANGRARNVEASPATGGGYPRRQGAEQLYDPELHIMRTNNKGWEYCGNAQASVDGACQIIVACDVTDASNDKQQAEPVAQATLATLAQRVLSIPRTRRALPAPSRRPWIMAITVRRRWRR